MDTGELESVIEGILFAAGEPISLTRLAQAADVEPGEAERAARSVADRLRYERRGMRIAEMDGVYQMVSAPEYAPLIRKAMEERRPPPLSKAALEVLCVTAYRQPVTRAEIERIRGVDSSNTVALLAEKGLIEEAGRLDVLGRPMQYRTTPAFLRTFGLKSLDELPDIEQMEGQLAMLADMQGVSP
ncbi:MAG: SMC-Scp complex subunit ScpB [Oscillospiraceae bacterium]|nr:SMC-Scp complex subunit ScpB [Oscillospiraceae bacterium]